MGTLAIAFALAWAAVACYAAWLGLQHHRLRQRLDELESVIGEEASRRPWSRAA